MVVPDDAFSGVMSRGAALLDCAWLAEDLIMARRGISVILLIGLMAARAEAASDCGASVVDPLAMQTSVVIPASSHLADDRLRLGAPIGVLSAAPDESMAVDTILYRIRQRDCRKIAIAAAAKPLVNDPAAYKPNTPFDNTPWRFNMNQNGKRMTADEFDAWMRARGVRVVKARPAVDTTAAPAGSPVTPDPSKSPPR